MLCYKFITFLLRFCYIFVKKKLQINITFLLIICCKYITIQKENFVRILQEKNLSLALSKGIPMPGNSYLSTVEQIKDTLANQKTNIKKLVKSIT